MCASPPVRAPSLRTRLDVWTRTLVLLCTSTPLIRAPASRFHLARFCDFNFLFAGAPVPLGRSCYFWYAPPPPPAPAPSGQEPPTRRRAAGTLLAAARVSRLVERVGGERRGAGHEEPPRERVHLCTRGYHCLTLSPAAHTSAVHNRTHFVYVTRVLQSYTIRGT